MSAKKHIYAVESPQRLEARTSAKPKRLCTVPGTFSVATVKYICLLLNS
ncbi:MAG: hypothetical protein WAU00_14595 [Caldilinea sp.]